MSAAEKSLPVMVAAPAPHEEEARVYIRPNLNRDASALMGMLLVVITYHIQHPTLLFRAQFGRSFRGDSLQEAVSIALLLAIALMVDSWRKWWQDRHQPLGQLRIALVTVVILYAAHNLLAIWQQTNLFFDAYSLTPEFLEDAFREEAYLQPVKALNGMALFTGAALASVVFLWSPWEYLRQPLIWIIRAVMGLAALLLIFAAYQDQHPIMPVHRSDQLALMLIIGVSSLITHTIFLKPVEILVYPYGRLKTFTSFVVLLYAILIFSEDNFFADFYEVSSYGELVSATGLHDALRAFDYNAMFAGAALISILYIMSPWERLPIYFSTIRSNILPLAVAVGTIIFWERAIDLFEIEAFLLPKPSVIWTEFKEEYPKLVAAGWFTFQNALLGFLAGCTAGVLTGIVSARFTHFSRAILPLAIAANSIPMIAFAPIANFWFGVTSINSKIAIVAVLCYFPSMISTVRGLTSVQPIQLELMRSYAATEFEIFRALRIPTALPLIFSALKLCTTLAMIGAIVSEFFGGSLAGLGYRIREDAALFRFPASWSAILVASLFGISFYMLVSALERAAMPWYRSFRDEAG